MSDAPVAELTGAQTLLLRAALQTDAGATSAWRAWLATEDLDEISSLDFSLLPLAAYNLQAQSVSDGPVGRLRGVLRQSWYKNQLRLADMAAALTALAQAGIRSLVIGDAALAARIYARPGLRPIGQLDLLVRPADASAAHRALALAGWEPAYGGCILARQMAIRPFSLLNHAQRQPLRLNWRMFATDPEAVGDSTVWDTAMPTYVGGAPAHTPDAAHLLLHACTAGAVRPGPLALIWLADAATLLCHWSGELDASGAFTGARLALLTAALGNLRLVQDIAGVPILPAPLASLAWDAAAASPRPASNGHNALTLSAAGGLASMALLWRRYRGLPPADRRLFAPLGFAAYLQCWWNLAHASSTSGRSPAPPGASRARPAAGAVRSPD